MVDTSLIGSKKIIDFIFFFRFSESNTKVVINGEVREKATQAPCLLNALPIEVEITQKAQMSSNMFARLKMAYAMKLRDLLDEKLGTFHPLRKQSFAQFWSILTIFCPTSST